MPTNFVAFWPFDRGWRKSGRSGPTGFVNRFSVQIEARRPIDFLSPGTVKNSDGHRPLRVAETHEVRGAAPGARRPEGRAGAGVVDSGVPAICTAETWRNGNEPEVAGAPQLPLGGAANAEEAGARSSRRPCCRDTQGRCRDGEAPPLDSAVSDAWLVPASGVDSYGGRSWPVNCVGGDLRTGAQGTAK